MKQISQQSPTAETISFHWFGSQVDINNSNTVVFIDVVRGASISSGHDRFGDQQYFVVVAARLPSSPSTLKPCSGFAFRRIMDSHDQTTGGQLSQLLESL